MCVSELDPKLKEELRISINNILSELQDGLKKLEKGRALSESLAK